MWITGSIDDPQYSVLPCGDNIEACTDILAAWAQANDGVEPGEVLIIRSACDGDDCVDRYQRHAGSDVVFMRRLLARFERASRAIAAGGGVGGGPLQRWAATVVIRTNNATGGDGNTGRIDDANGLGGLPGSDTPGDTEVNRLQTVPEPSTLGLAVLGVLGVFGLTRRIRLV